MDKLKTAIANGENLPDLILLDLNMPVMDGWEFWNEFMQIPAPKRIDIYIVSSSINPEDTDRTKQYDVVKKYITKPITVELLKELRDNFDY